MSTSGGPAGFWRCGRCGTPNPNTAYLTHCVSCGVARSVAVLETPTPPKAEPAEAVRRRMGGSRKLVYGSVGGFLLSLLVLGLIKGLGGVWWPASFLLLSPRWIWLLPILPLFVWGAVTRNRPSLILNGLSLAIVLGPLMGLNIPWGGLWPFEASEPGTVRLLSLNRGAAPIQVDRLIRYIERNKIDVLCFQEIGKDPVLDDYLQKGWHREKDGYLATRHLIVEEIPPPPEENADQERYTMSVRRLKVRRADGLEFTVASVHMPTLSRGLNGGIGVGFRPNRFQAHLAWWSKEFGRLVETLSARQDGPLLVAGDLNMPSDHPLLRALQRQEIFQFAFEARGWGYGYTKPSSFPWIRIDHILASREWQVKRCWIGPDFGSDHQATVAEFTLPLPANP